jgi:putative chitinase
VSAFLATIAHESGSLRIMAENLNYSAEGLRRTFPTRFTAEEAVTYARQSQRIASKVYANRMGNGDEASGDGWRYRGRGPIQITGATNYRRCAAALAVDLIAHPELLEDPAIGCRAAAWWWVTGGLNEVSDAGDFDGVCDRVNRGHKTPAIGDSFGWIDRRDAYRRACAALQVATEV